MGNTVKPENLGAELVKILEEYRDETIADVKEAILKTADEDVEELKAKSPDSGRARRRKYRSGWTKTIVYESPLELRVKVHNKINYQLTHLLENGHAKVNGGRVPAQVHIKPVEEDSKERLVQRIKEAAQK